MIAALCGGVADAGCSCCGGSFSREEEKSVHFFLCREQNALQASAHADLAHAVSLIQAGTEFYFNGLCELERISKSQRQTGMVMTLIPSPAFHGVLQCLL